MENDTKLMDNIEKYIFEENKIVTYKWFSRQHNVHVNISKRLLSSFVDKTDEKLSISWMIGGVLSDGNHKVVVGWQQELPGIKRGFQSVTSEHVYSVQKKVANSSDLNVLLYSANCSSSEENITGQNNSSIKCDGCVLRSVSAVAEQKRKALLVAKSKSSEVTKTNNVNGKKPPNASEKESVAKGSINNETPATNGSKKTSSPKKTGIAAMFAAQKDTKKPENKEKVVQQPVKTKPKGLSAFFNRDNVNKNDSKVNDAVVKDPSPIKDKENKKSDNEEIEKPLEKSKDDSLKTKDTKNSKSKASVKKGGNKRKKSKNDDVSAKKRKRIVMLSDSESSDEEGYRSPSPEMREPTPPPPPVSDDEDFIPTTPQNGKKAKKKKLVEQTFLDDDGFLVSNKEYKLVSDSEEEKETNVTELAAEKPSEIEKPVQPEKAKTKEPKKKISPQKSKQSSITNFFKKS